MEQINKWQPGAALVSQIQDIIDDYDGFREWGIRVVHGDATVQVGSPLANSYRWEDHEQTDDELPGVCTIGVDKNSNSMDAAEMLEAINLLDAYLSHGKHVVLVRGELVCGGEDQGESIISDAVVVALWHV